MHRYILAFGSNLGDLKKNTELGLTKLREHSIQILNISNKIMTRPLQSDKFNTKNHQNYLNFVLEILTYLSAEELYSLIYMIENDIGHNRQKRWAPRSLDIDILFGAYHQDDLSFFKCVPYKINTETLHVPHLEISQRDFLKSLIEDLGYSFDKLMALHKT